MVFARSKPDVDPGTRWSPRRQLFPPALIPDATPHEPTKSPELCPLQDWKLGDQVKKDLEKFYSNNLRCVVTKIPDDVQQGKV